jgi:hypothetical protein
MCLARTPIGDTASGAGREAAGRASNEPREREPDQAEWLVFTPLVARSRAATPRRRTPR